MRPGSVDKFAGGAPRLADAARKDAFVSAWSDFTGADSVFETLPGDYPRWRRGRERYVAWVIPVDDATVIHRCRSLQGMLRDLLIDSARRAFHVTLFVCGFVARRPVLDDDVCERTLAMQAARLRRLRIKAFRLEVGGANSFLAAPFLEVRCPGGEIDALRGELGADTREPRFSAFVPHVTLGLFNAPHRVREVAARLANQRRLPAIEVTVTHVDLVSFDARHPASELHLEKRIEIGSADGA
ncbi:MAG: 2'-5' RNA ligase family protein [Proteobacteria bacterium]|nr:MAG: 2'-5' RNA ligase family protein [Pseudomonadota bacterium]